MFGRGNWAVIGLKPESVSAFRTAIGDPATLIRVSQTLADAVTRHQKIDSLGINPYAQPRLDETLTLAPWEQADLAQEKTTPAAVVELMAYLTTDTKPFEIERDRFAFWCVSNQWKDVSDGASLREGRAYDQFLRPYKFLQAGDKQHLDREAQAMTAIMRKQFPVLLDFIGGYAYIENTNKNAIVDVTHLLGLLGVETESLAWHFNVSGHWPSLVLNSLYQNTEFLQEFKARAEDAARFKAEEIEKLEDRELEGIVSNFFSMTPAEGDFWAGISAPAQIRLHPTSDSVTVKAQTGATSLLQITEDAQIQSASITIQERLQRRNKKGEEITFRKDMLRFDLNDNINLVDVGAAMLRGFDIPAFKRDLTREIRKTKQVPDIGQFWASWLREMNIGVRHIEATLRYVLGLDADQEGGLIRVVKASLDAVLEPGDEEKAA